MQKLLVLVLIPLLMIGCGGGGSSLSNTGASNTANQLQGFYTNTTSNGNVFETIVLPTGKLYELYGAMAGNTFVTNGMIVGQGTSNNGTYTANISDYKNMGALFNGKVTASYVPGVSVSGTASETGNSPISFTGDVPANTSFNTPAQLSSLTGTWTGSVQGGLSLRAIDTIATGNSGSQPVSQTSTTGFATAAAMAIDQSGGTIPGGDQRTAWQNAILRQSAISATSLSSIRVADRFAGADLGAKINAADGALGGSAGEIWVFNTAGLTITTAVSISANHVVRFFAGTFFQSAAITLGNNAMLAGSGMYVTVLSNTTTATPSIVLSGTGSGVRDCTITRTATATAGGTGIVQVGSDDNLIADVLVTNHWIGVSLGSASYSVFRNSIIAKNLSDGVFMQNIATVAAAQWQLQDLLSTQNGGSGFRAQSAAGPKGMILGSWRNLQTYANSGYGIAILGTASVPVYALRLVDGFIGEDANGGIYMDSYGGEHRIFSVDVEYEGTSATGPMLATPATNAANGIQISANNADVSIIGCAVYNNSYDGIVTSAAHATIVGNNVYNNGAALVPANQLGIYVVAGQAVVIGNQVFPNGATTQLYGVYSQVDSIVGSGNYLAGADAGFASAATPTNSSDGDLFSGLIMSMTVRSDGTFSGSSAAGCQFSGAFTSDSSNKNFFDMTLTTGADCLYPGQAVSGIAVNYLLSDGVTQQLVAGGVDTTNTSLAIQFAAIK